MPDDQDYEWLGRFLASAEHWTDEDSATAQALRRNQVDLSASMHPADWRSRIRLSKLVIEIDTAIAQWSASQR